MNPSDLTACVDIVELVSAYLDGELAPEEAAAVEAHLALCDGCTTYFEQVRRTVAAVRQVQPRDLPEDLREGLLAAFRDLRPGERG